MLDNVVKDKYGCVNKISNFDKDLMLLVIFGLRGFKHELESQIALKCATECREKIAAMDHVHGIAAGVTTGKCYCGAFGHTLRREYTVIGLVVNKAARLMVAYPDRVTCDRSTFLHSKLESRNFILQEYKTLKGIINPGPIYEFKGVEKFQETTLFFNPLPILGREQEIDLFITLLERAERLSVEKSQKQFNNMLILQGVYRQGKSRLLEELIFVTDPNIPVNRFAVNAFDYEMPYRTIQLLFQRFTEIIPEMPEHEKQQKIKARLRMRPDVEPFLCYLNIVFNVNFPITEEYKRQDKKGKYKMLRNTFKIFCQQVFKIFWLIAIDDAEYIDDESWLLIDILLDLNLVFIVVTMGTEKEISVLAINVLKKSRIKSIELKGIDKWYHVGLACQMLNVDGIPPELEKTIQTKSNGNPGWIESFLVSLMQSGGLFVYEMTRQNAYDTGIVIPPLYMTVRMSKEEMKLWVEIMEERNLSSKENKMTIRWKMFIDSCRESYPDLTVAQTFNDKIKKNQLINICTLNESFNLEDVDPELAIDVIILKTFDALTSYEQLLLKCSAILGDTFPRDMLLYIMSSSAIRLTALAVQKLFEINVLSCAKGNFIEGGLSFKERLVNPNEDMSVKCDCKGLIIDETCTDLPKYASCGYMRFRSSEFRETTYNLLTDNQKREFHERAIRYLEKETRRCRACGNGYFVRQMGGGRLDNTLRILRRKDKKKSVSTETSSIAENFGANKLLQRASFVSFESYQSGKSREYSRGTNTLSLYSSGSGADSMSLPDSHHYFSMSNDIGFTTIRKLKDNYNLIRTFSTTDYTQCTCPLVLNTMYSQLIEHCKGAGLVEKIMNATIEYSYVCIENRNIPQTIKVLEEALQLLDGPMKEQVELDWMIELKRGKLFTLLGSAHMEMNDDETYTYLMKALKCYGVNFPTTRFFKALKKAQMKLKHMLRFFMTRSVFSRRTDDDVSEYCNNVSECLAFLCKFFIIKHRWKEAELAAMWSLSKAIETETDFEKICMAYGNLIFITSNLGHNRMCIALEVFALRTCHKKKTYVELEELKAVSFLYFTISRGRLRRAEIEKFLHIGYVVWRLSTSSQNEMLAFRMLPLLAHVVLLRRQLLEYNNMLQEIQYLFVNDTDNSQMAWYYALCMVVCLETGLIVEPYSKCVKFMQGEGLEPTIRDPDGKMRLIICIWLWEVRNNNWEASMVWQKVAWDFKIRDVGDSVQNFITGLYLIEGLIIYLVNKMDKKNLKAIARTNERLIELFKHYDKGSKYCQVVIPRLYHMKAYYRIARYNDYRGGLKLLKIGKKYAEMYLNDLELLYMKHSELGWCRKLSREDSSFWREHSDEENKLDLNDIDQLDKYIPYTLPVPIYI
nr:adenylate cyclase type 10-like [Leptinotarsa decemlineata]